MKIAVIGHMGFVGGKMLDVFRSRGLEVVGVDRDWWSYEFSTIGWKDDFDLQSGRDAANACDLAVVCVPTPRSDSGIDTVAVTNVMDWLRTPTIAIKSTVPVGFCEELQAYVPSRIVHWPEFVGESKYAVREWERDPVRAPWQLFGFTSKSHADAWGLCTLWMQVAGPHCRLHVVHSKVTEFAKLWSNSWAAAKIGLMNEMRDLCEANGVPYHLAREAWLHDPRISRDHTMALGSFGGKCLPKDLNAMLRCGTDNGYHPVILEAVHDENERRRGDV